MRKFCSDNRDHLSGPAQGPGDPSYADLTCGKPPACQRYLSIPATAWGLSSGQPGKTGVCGAAWRRSRHRRASLPTSVAAAKAATTTIPIVFAIGADHRPMLGDYASSCGSWSLYSATGTIPMALSEAIIATYITIHMARSPVHTVRELRLLPGVAGGSFRAFWHHPPPTSKAPDRPDFHRRLRFTRRFARKGREVADRLRRLGRRERR